MLNTLIDFVFPARCIICGKSPSLLCTTCEPVARPGEFELDGVEGTYIFDYKDVSEVISDFKDKLKLGHAKFLSERLATHLQALVREQSIDLILIPGSSRENYKKRGFTPGQHLVAKALRRSGVQVPVGRLRRTREVKDQRALGAHQRRQNVAGTMAAGNVFQKRILLFDDVLTTGATLTEMIRAVTSAGGQVVGICVLAKRN